MKADLNVCLMNDAFPPVIDGVSNAVLNYALIINAKYGKAAVATPRYPGAEDNYAFPVIRYPSIGINSKPLKSYRAGYPFDPAALKKLEAMRFDIIHSHCPAVSTVLARRLRDLADIPIVFTYHTKFDIDISNAINGELMRRAAIRLLVENIKACDEIWVVSRGAGENLKNLGYSGDYLIMENGVDLPKGRAKPEDVEKLRLEYGLESGTTVFLFVGRLMWYKGLRLIIDGLSALKARRQTPFKMVFVGEGADGEEAAAYAERSSLDGECVFVGAVRDRERLRAWYTLADALLFPSTFDTNGLVVREAAACGLPSVLLKDSCAAEGITDGRTGILIENDLQAMADALERICENPERMKGIGEAAMEEIYISWDESVRRAVERYGAVLENWKSGGKRRLRAPDDEDIILSDKLLDEVENMKVGSALWPELKRSVTLRSRRAKRQK